MYSPDGAHLKMLAKKPLMAYDETRDFATQKEEITAKLMELFGDMPDKIVDPKMQIEQVVEGDDYTEYRFNFYTEEDVQAICRLRIPKVKKDKYPLVICLQGHGKGMHRSFGEIKYPDFGEGPEDGDRDVGNQAIERGYAALAIDQRGMGERRTMLDIDPNDADDGETRCRLTSNTALLLGRTIIGERCWDVSRALDVALANWPVLDGDKIICTGNSGGGTATFYAAAFDKRIKVAMPCCSVCTWKHSIAAMIHCECNYIPGLGKYMDMGDIAAAIAPRKLIIINGRHDPIFLHEGVVETFETVKKIYKAAGVPDNCAMVTGEGGHRYYKDIAWAAFDKMGGVEE
ncbi:MAG: acetylxylan esterase [Clostridia bacterium]|nr:acetylxylan esterase [Clostridia bacterium]